MPLENKLINWLLNPTVTASAALAQETAQQSAVLEEGLRDVTRELKKMNMYLSHMNDFIVEDEDVEV